MIVAFTRLHYGADYLYYAIKALVDSVDRYVVQYSASPTFGHATDLPNVDTRNQLRAIAAAAAGDKLIWIDTAQQGHEYVVDLYPEAGLIIEADADEVYHDALTASILKAYANGELSCRRYRVPFVHHWRSFDHVCIDSQSPIRLFLPHAPVVAEGSLAFSAAVHHFGYARREEETRYKIATSVHLPEWRDGWWELWRDWTPDSPRQADLHPVSFNFWNTQRIDRRTLPHVLSTHPYFDMEVIR